MREWLPPDHLVWFVLETIDALDTTALERTRRRGGAGAAGFDPRMLFGLLVYAYCHGVGSSRQIERMCVTDVAFRVLCAQDAPDHTTIARFRSEAQEAFSDLFSQVLMIAARAGLGRFGTVAIDGTKIKANASIDANRGREWFNQNVAAMLADADRTGPTMPRTSRRMKVPVMTGRIGSLLTWRIAAAVVSGSSWRPKSSRLNASDGLASGRSVRRLRWRAAAAPSKDSRSWAGSRTDHTGWPRPARTWHAGLGIHRPNWIDTQP
jgi:transposase